MRYLLIAIFCSTLAKAEIGTDKYLHFGATAAFTTFSYVWYREAFKMDPWTARLASTFVGTMVNLSAEAMDARPDAEDLLAGQLGVFTTIGFTIAIDW